jgi:hypothetical protein
MTKGRKMDQNTLTRDFIREQTGLDIPQSDAENIHRSLVEYCRILIEIDQKPTDAKPENPVSNPAPFRKVFQ